MITNRFKKLRAGRDRVSASEYNRMSKTVSALSRSLVNYGTMDNTGIIARKQPASKQGTMRMVRTTQDAPADTKITANLLDNSGNEISTEVNIYCLTNGGGNLNVSVPLLKNDQYIFVVYTLNAWWCAELFNNGQTGIAFVKTTPGAVTSLSCWFSESDNTGETISVPCAISGGGNLNTALPRVIDGTQIGVAKKGAIWYLPGAPFQASEDCDCYSEP